MNFSGFKVQNRSAVGSVWPALVSARGVEARGETAGSDAPRSAFRIPHSALAFSLLELLIAVMAFAIVLAAINGVFYSGLKLRNRSAAALEKSLPLAQAVTVIKRDLAGIAIPSTNDTRLIGELQSSPEISGTTDQPRFGSLTGAGAAGGSSGQLTRVGPELYTLSGLLDTTLPWPNVQKVAYLLVDSTNPAALGKDLVRSVTRNLLPSGGIEELPVEQLLLNDVADVLFTYHNGIEWQETWDSTSADPKLPRAIKVAIQFAADMPANQPAPMEIVVPLTVQASTNSTSSGGSE